MPSTCPNCLAPLPENARCPKCSSLSPATGGGEKPVGPTGVELPSEFKARYQILRSLGKGASGEVFQARDKNLSRQVAIKFCLKRVDSGSLKNFQKEVDLLTSLKHKSVVEIYSWGLIGEVPFLVMEFLRGQTLRSLLKRKTTLSVQSSVSIITQILHALDEAHNLGIIHRDLKPENIMVDQDGRAVLLDLGIAKSWADGSAAQQSSQITGTPLYMAPEQCRGEPTGIGADLYSVGVILFECLAGQPPYGGPNAVAIIREHLEAKIPRVTDFQTSLPGFWDNLLAKALAKAVADRFTDASSFSIALEKALAGGGGAAFSQAAKDLERRTLLRMPTNPAYAAVGYSLVGGLLAGIGGLLIMGDAFGALGCVLPLTSIFMAEEPGRFKQLTANEKWRVSVYVFAVVMVGYLIQETSRGDGMPMVPYVGTILAVVLAWFGGYHSRDPSDSAGIGSHRAGHVVLLIMLTWICRESMAGVGFGTLATLLAFLLIFRRPAKTRHLSIGEATTMILLAGAVEEECQEKTQVGIDVPQKPRVMVRTSPQIAKVKKGDEPDS